MKPTASMAKIEARLNALKRVQTEITSTLAHTQEGAPTRGVLQTLWEAPRQWSSNVFQQQEPQLAAVVDEAVATNAANKEAAVAITPDVKPADVMQAVILTETNVNERGSLIEDSEMLFMPSVAVAKESSPADAGLSA